LTIDEVKREKDISAVRRLGRLLVIAVAFGFVIGIFLDRQVLSLLIPCNNIPFGAVSSFDLMAEGWDLIERFYVDRTMVKPRIMTYGAISGMVAALGDTGHSVFLSPDMVKRENDFNQGRFKGVGIEVQMKAGRVVIVTCLDGTPAQRAGLSNGEIILKVDGKDITGLNLGQVVRQVAGPAGTSVSLTVFDSHDERTRTVTLKRTSIAVHNVTWQRLPGTTIAHVRIKAFSLGVTKDLRKTLTEIQNENLNGIILDMRNNPGGIIDEAIATASQFLKSGNVLLARNAKGTITPLAVQPGGLATKIRMVVLINGGTASAAEIVAGALQDSHRALILGESSFGTGTVLEEFTLSDGSALMLAVEEWLTPDAKAIWHKGITPDQVVTMARNVTPLLPELERNIRSAQLLASADNQLLAALKELTGVTD